MFPENISIIVTEAITGKPIENIAIMLTLFANKKNNYNLHPSLSDINGIIEISKKWIEEEIQKERNLFIMDYASTIDDCKSLIEINVLNCEELIKLANGMKSYQDYFGYSDIDIDKVKNASNKYYNSLSMKLNFTGERAVQLDLNLMQN